MLVHRITYFAPVRAGQKLHLATEADKQTQMCLIQQVEDIQLAATGFKDGDKAFIEALEMDEATFSALPLAPF
jgi:hypothetical protein